MNKVYSCVSYFYMYIVKFRTEYFMESQMFETAITQKLISHKNLINMEISVFEWEGA